MIFKPPILVIQCPFCLSRITDYNFPSDHFPILNFLNVVTIVTAVLRYYFTTHNLKKITICILPQRDFHHISSVI